MKQQVRLWNCSTLANVDALSEGTGYHGDRSLVRFPQFSCSVSTSVANFSSSSSAPKESESFFAGLKVNFLSQQTSPR